VAHGGLTRRWFAIGKTLGGESDTPGLGLSQPGDRKRHDSTLRAPRGHHLPDLKTADHVAVMGAEKVAWFADSEGDVLCLHKVIGDMSS
jgi:hypothetical protein